jgi:hypothetical protein
MRTDSMLSEPQTVEGTGTLQFRPPEGQAGQFAGVTVTNLSGYPVLVSSSAQQVMVPAGITAPVPYNGSGQPVTVAAVAGSLGSPGPITARWYYVGSVMPAVAVPATTLDTGPADVNVTNATLTVETSGTIDTNVTNSSLTVDASGSTIELASGTSVALDASTATIGTVELASGSSVDLASGASVDANITNATLDITGSSVNVSGGQLKTSGGLGLQPTSEQLNPAWLGDGSDGDVTISGTVTLTRDMLYSSLTVPSGAVVATAGFRIRCTGTITLDGSITNNGTDGAVSGGGLGAPAGTLPGGGNGGFTNNSGSGTAAAGFQSGLCLYGGGLGQSVLAINGATAAQGGGNGSDTPTPTIFPTISQMVSGAIGGGGGGAAYSNISDEVSNGGGGGGPILILCNEFTGSGALASIGGSGYCESTGAAGGGGSGNVIVVCFTQSFTGNINVLGGTGVQSADYLGPAAGNGIGFILDGIEW